MSDWNFPVRPYGDWWITSGLANPDHPSEWLHTGVDLNTHNDRGKPVWCIGPGTVETVQWYRWLGWTVLVFHPAVTKWSLYAHLERATVEEGQDVDQYTRIGPVGDSGVVTGPHLHFEIRKRPAKANKATMSRSELAEIWEDPIPALEALMSQPETPPEEPGVPPPIPEPTGTAWQRFWAMLAELIKQLVNLFSRKGG